MEKGSAGWAGRGLEGRHRRWYCGEGATRDGPEVLSGLQWRVVGAVEFLGTFSCPGFLYFYCLPGYRVYRQMSSGSEGKTPLKKSKQQFVPLLELVPEELRSLCNKLLIQGGIVMISPYQQAS